MLSTPPAHGSCSRATRRILSHVLRTQVLFKIWPHILTPFLSLSHTVCTSLNRVFIFSGSVSSFVRWTQKYQLTMQGIVWIKWLFSFSIVIFGGFLIECPLKFHASAGIPAMWRLSTYCYTTSAWPDTCFSPSCDLSVGPTLAPCLGCGYFLHDIFLDPFHSNT